MNPNKRKSEWIANAPTDVLQNIVNTLAGPEAHEQSPRYPLGGLVHISGVGQIKVTAIKSELALRKEVANAGRIQNT
jgi:hypothetical protein